MDEIKNKAATMTLKELREAVAAKSAKLHEVWEQAGEDYDMSKVTCLDAGDTQSKLEKVAQLTKELEVYQQALEEKKSQVEALKGNEDTYRDMHKPQRVPHPGAKGESKEYKPWTERLVEIKDWQQRLRNGEELLIPGFSVKEVKTLFQTSAGWAPESLRTGRVVPDAQRPVAVLDIIPVTTTTQAAVVYMEETTFTNSAAETSEGAAYPESALALTEQSSTVRKIATFIPVTDEQLEDVPQVQGYLNNRLTFMLRQRLDSQILVGDGVAPNLQGLSTHGSVQTQAKGTDPTFDACHKALTKVRSTAYADPSHFVFHPNDWEDIRLTRTADGIYILGNPEQAGPERLWGLPVVITTAMTENTGFVGAFRDFAELAERTGIEVKVSDSHDDYFVKGKQAVRASVRVALLNYRPEAFCTITGI